MGNRTNLRNCFFLVLLVVGWTSRSQAALVVDVTVTFENLAPTNSVAFAPLRLGFGNGTFDAFNSGEAATDPIISVAERGTGNTWFPAFSAAEPNAVLGSVVGSGALPQLVPAGNANMNRASTGSQTFRVDTGVNRFFTFASMVVPSNDLFIGNDDPMEYELFDATGNLLINEIFVSAGEIWDAGSELAIPLNGAFVVGATNGNRVEQNGVVSFDFSELAAFNGFTTAHGYSFTNAGLTGGTHIGRISFSVTVVPEPSSLALVGLMSVGIVFRRHRKRVSVATSVS
jgi:hypothetical protein